MLLKKYVLMRFLNFYLFAAGGLVGIFLMGDFFERADEFISKNTPFLETIWYYILKIPFVIFYMAPQAVLIATVIAIASLAKTQEITAMKACGISVTGIAMPIVGMSVLIACLILLCNEYIAPVTSKKMNYIYYVKVHKRYSYGMIEKKKIWYKSETGAIWNIETFDHKNGVLHGIRIFFPSGDQSINKRVDCEQAVWTQGRWEFQDGTIRSFDASGLEKTEYFEKTYLKVPETPEDFKTYKIRPEEMSIRSMYDEIKSREADGMDVSEKWVDLNYKLSYPFIGIVLALIGIPLSLRSSRHGGVLFSVAVNLAMGLAFSFVYAMAVSLGRGGTFGPLMAAWGPIALFTAIGFYLILTIDNEKLLPFME